MEIVSTNIKFDQEVIINSILDDIDEFISFPKFSENKFETYIKALKVFLNLPNSTNAILYQINTDTFEFQYSISEPIINEELALEKLNCYINNGAIGKVLQNAQIYVFPNLEDNLIKVDCMIIPLIASWGIIGLVFVRIENVNDQLSKLIYRLYNSHASNFAGVIERVELNQKLKYTKAELEQRIAIKTMELENSGRELRIIMDSVQTGILVTDLNNNTINRINFYALTLIGLNELKIMNSNVINYIENFDENNYETQETFLVNYISDKIPILLKISFVNFGNTNYKIFSFVDITIRKKAENELKIVNENLEQTILERTFELKLLIERLEKEIIERKQAEADILRMLNLEKELNELKSRFISMVSHEFRTPLTIIKSSAQFVETFYDKLLFDDKRQYLQRISSTVDFITNLLENIIFIEKSNVKKVTLTFTKVNLKALIENIIGELNLTNKIHRNFKYNNNSLIEYLRTDEQLLKLILSNIISNAFKYSDEECL
ncbi:MAG: HAMP domain-containing sensor histidine kinase, partial [Candidatus Kapabacteria bacterium]|nr:HAMP domain-containing sensor histidine kinase [Candidatus Kapabacteria bacterium]